MWEKVRKSLCYQAVRWKKKAQRKLIHAIKCESFSVEDVFFFLGARKKKIYVFIKTNFNGVV
jgi:hypothetical protein